MLTSLNERLRKISAGFRLYEDDYEAIWLEDGSNTKAKLRRLGTLIDAERYVTELEGRGPHKQRVGAH